MGKNLKTFFETEIKRQAREIKSMERKVANGETCWLSQIELNRKNIAGYQAELAAA